jgi:hypothetical protein
MRLYIGLLFCSFLGFNLSSQGLLIQAVKSEGEIKVDGDLNELAWQQAKFISGFTQQFPYDTSLAETQTKVKMIFDEKYIYVGAVCLDPNDGDYVVQSLKRDFSFSITDAFAVFLDPYSDKQNGFSFAVSPYNVQREGLLIRGGSYGVSTSWDNGWTSQVKRYQDKWIVEMAIPKKSIRFNEGSKQWRVNFARNDLKINETSVWAPVPRNQNVANMGFMGSLIFSEPPSKTGKNMVIIPYAISSFSEDKQSDPVSQDWTANIGGDAKIAITSSLNLDITVNPDFAQVDVDQQVTNLSRFSIFFPERRQFFLENADLFGNFGFSKIRPFFSRNIGLNYGAVIPIYAGARLSGKLNAKTRVGLMNMQTGRNSENTLDPMSYTVGAIQRSVFANSTIGGIVVNKTSTENPSVSNTVVGVDFNYTSKNNRWRGQAFSHHSIESGQEKLALANASWLMYEDQNIFFMWNHEFVGKGYTAGVGFVPRLNNYNPELGVSEKRSYWRWEPAIGYKFYPKSKWLNWHGPKVYISEYQDSSFRTTDRIATASYAFSLKDGSSLTFQGVNNEVNLFFDTDVSFSGSESIEAGRYGYNFAEVVLNTTKRNKVYGNLNVGGGNYYTGQRFFYSGGITMRYKRWVNLSLNYSRNEIDLPHLDEKVVLNLIGPKVNVTFTNNIFFTTFFQYNDQIDNFNINSRLQWRFKPMSDLFIVYTDNHFTTDYVLKNRSLVAKLVYWLPL